MSLNQQQTERLKRCLAHRIPLLDPEHQSAVRLLNGFYEGFPDLVADLFGRTLVLSAYSRNADMADDGTGLLQAFFLEQLPWIETVLVKARHIDADLRRGTITCGSQLQRSIWENGIQYALDLQLNQDASFYLDTRHLRFWLHDNLAGKSVLNSFAYTGTLGIAAMAGGASTVAQTDINPRFLALARESTRLNRLPGNQINTITMDFFKVIDRFKTSQTLFDCIILDPPFFSTTTAGKVDLVGEYKRLINKVRPLVGHDGWLVLINNALFVSGAEMMAQLNLLCGGPYLQIHELITVPEDVTGYGDTITTPPPADPAPFNHPTKIAILKVTRKDGCKAG